MRMLQGRCPAALGPGHVPLWPTPMRHSARCRLLGLAPHCLDPHRIAWIHTALGAVAVVPRNAQRQANRSFLPPTSAYDPLASGRPDGRLLGGAPPPPPPALFHIRRMLHA